MQGQLQPHCPSCTNTNFSFLHIPAGNPFEVVRGFNPPTACSGLLPFPIAEGGDLNAGRCSQGSRIHSAMPALPDGRDALMSKTLGDGLGAKSDAGVLGWVPALPPSSRAVGEVSRKAGDCLTSSSVRLNVLSSSGRAAGAKCVVPTGFMLWDEELPVCSLCLSFLPQLEESLVHCSKAEVGTCCI